VPSSAVGGDYFDFLRIPDGRWAVVVADVSGNGIPASLIMAGFRADLRAELRRADEPRGILDRVNAVLCTELEPDHFVTAFLGVYSPESGTLEHASAGHEPGLVLRASGEVEPLSAGGLLLGVFPEAVYRSATTRLDPGDRLVLYTDGLSDTEGAAGEPLGPEGLVRLLRELEAEGVPPGRWPDVLLERLPERAAHPAGEPDDRTLVVLARDRG